MNVNVLSFDIEHWYESFLYRNVSGWEKTPYSDAKTVEWLIDQLVQTRNSATFFITGKFASENRKLVRRAYEHGIEIASHSYSHQVLTVMTQEEIYQDLEKSKSILEDIICDSVKGFRAPKWSVNYENKDIIYDILADLGFTYDSSIFPFNFSKGNFKIEERQRFNTLHGDIDVLPVTTLKILGIRVPQGGFYFRLLPFLLTEKLFNQSIISERKFNHLFLHPYDVDSNVPWVKGAPPLINLFKKFNTKKSKKNLNRLLKNSQFIGVNDYILGTIKQT